MDINKIISKSKYFEANILEYAKGKLVIKTNLEPIVFNKSIDWNYQHPQSSRTYQVYLHSLNIVKDFVQMYLKTSENRYLKNASDIIKNWYKYNSEYDTKNLAWNEHAASYRINNIIYYQEHAEKMRLSSSLFSKIINDHVGFLNNDLNYKDNNHGIMMDNSLLLASYYLEDKEKKELILSKIYYRLNYSIQRDFSYKGMHLENSPEYHRLVLTLLNRSKRILNELGRPFSNEIIEVLENAKKLNSVIIKPNRMYPIVGDTGMIIDRKMPKKFIDYVDHEAGISIFNKKNSESIFNSTWLLFKSGYQRITHKHLDDLSVNLYLDGHDVFIDSGKYNYENNNPIRQNIISPAGHSTIYVEDKQYTLTNPKKDNLKMSLNKHINKSKYKLISGKNNLYSSTFLSRTCILTDTNELIIFDSVKSKFNQSYIQNFILNPDAIVIKENETTFSIRINDNKYFLQIFSHKNEEIKTVSKDTIISLEFGKTIKTKKIQFKKTSTNTSFLTVFYKEGNEDNIKDIKIENSSIVFRDKNKKNIINL